MVSFAPLLKKILCLVTEDFYITKLRHNKRLILLQPLSHYLIVYEKMCHLSCDCRSGLKQQIQNKFKFKSIVLISPRHLIIHLVNLMPFAGQILRLFLKAWQSLIKKLFITIHVFGLDCSTYRPIINLSNHTRGNCESHRMLSIVDQNCSSSFTDFHWRDVRSGCWIRTMV